MLTAVVLLLSMSQASVGQAVPLTSADVGRIVTAAVREATKGGLGTEEPGQPLVVDITSSNAAFEAYAKRPLPIARTSWLPDIEHRDAGAQSVLNCRTPGVFDSSCRVAGSGAFVQVIEVNPGAGAGALSVRLRVVWTRSTKHGTRLSGFTALLEVMRERDTWLARTVRATVG